MLKISKTSVSSPVSFSFSKPISTKFLPLKRPPSKPLLNTQSSSKLGRRIFPSIKKS